MNASVSVPLILSFFIFFPESNHDINQNIFAYCNLSFKSIEKKIHENISKKLFVEHFILLFDKILTRIITTKPMRRKTSTIELITDNQ